MSLPPEFKDAWAAYLDDPTAHSLHIRMIEAKACEAILDAFMSGWKLGWTAGTQILSEPAQDVINEYTEDRFLRSETLAVLEAAIARVTPPASPE